MFENEKKDWTKEIEKWQKNIGKLENFKNYVVSTCGKIDKSKKDPFSTSKSSKYYELIPSAERSQLEKSIDYFMKILKDVRDFEDRWDKDIEAFNSGKENKDAYSSFVQKFTVDGLDPTISDDIEKIKKDIYGLKDRNYSLEFRTKDLNSCISQISKSIEKIIKSVYADDHKMMPTWMAIDLDISFDPFKDIQPEPDILRKEICGSRRNCSNLRKCISKFLASSEFKKLESNKTKARKCRNIKRILEFYSESLGFIDSYLSDIQNRDKASFGPSIRRVDESIAKKTDVWMDMPMWKLRKFKPYLSYKDVEQGDIGDCWLSATLKSMAKKNPDVLLNAFVNKDKEIGDQKTNSKNIMFHNELAQFPLTPYITVRLYKVKKTEDEYKTNGDYVDIQVPATLLRSSSGNSHWNQGTVLWPHIIEKAVEKYLEEFMPNQGKGKGKHIDGGHSIIAAALLTGESPTRNKINSKSNPQQTLDLLKKLLSNGKAAMCGTIKFQETDDDHSESRKVLEWQEITHEEAKKYDRKTLRLYFDSKGEQHYEIPKRIIWGTHAYSLDKVENATPIENTKIHLINPWEVKDDKVGRNKIYVTLKEFLENFDRVDS